MFDIGWSELAVIAVVALVVIGPKDLPRVLRTVGAWVAKARSMAREFQNSVDEMAREADLQDVKKHIDDLRSANVADLIEKHVDPKGDLRQALEPPKELSHDPFGVGTPGDYVPPAAASADTAAADTVTADDAPTTVAAGAAPAPEPAAPPAAVPPAEPKPPPGAA